MASTEADGDKSWEEVVRQMLPHGAPLPDENHLDYSIAVEYTGPPVAFDPPMVQTLERKPLSMTRVSSAVETRRNPSQDESEDDERGSPSHEAFSESMGRHTVVTFNEARSEERVEEGEYEEEVVSVGNSQSSEVIAEKRERRRGLCSRCGKVNILKEREACLVCDARYCRNCVLRAMGSMPEGRKCDGCIGRPIDELKRRRLGKPSRLLCKLCSPPEVRHIMKAESECPANQLRPNQLILNGKQLSQEELDELMGCPNPPQKLKPGRYWYDSPSGLWGKEGQRPDRIVSSKLSVGGKLHRNASNGNTEVFINGREITKLELWVLRKAADVQCPKGTSFWVYEDGSYQEEGHNKIKGKIWEKTTTRLLCSLFSLPTPCGNSSGSKESAPTFSTRSVPEYWEQKRVQKLFLIGLEGSGTGTIFKQAKFLYGSNFSREEMEKIKLMIQSNLYKYIGILLEARERFEEEALEELKHAVQPGSSEQDENGVENKCQCIYSINQRLKKFSDWLLEIMAMGDLEAFFPAATREYAPTVEEAWRDPAIQETYRRRSELPFLPDVASYFLERAVHMSNNEYEPSERDILYAEGVDQCNSLVSLDFSLDERSPMSEMHMEKIDGQPPSTKYQLIRVNSKGLTNGCKWLAMFEDVRAVIFCVALSDYDQQWPQDSGSLLNKMIANRDLFESLVRHPSFRETPFVLLLNKYDAFEEKINKVPLSVCEWFRDFCPVRPLNSSHNSSQSVASNAYFYVAMKFKDLYASISGRKLFVGQTKARDRVTIDEAFKYIREILKWEEIKDGHLHPDESFYSTTEMSSSLYVPQ